MTQEDLVLQLDEEGMSAIAIHTRLVDVFVSLALTYLWVMRIARTASWSDNSPASP
jgi:hypothetical protein